MLLVVVELLFVGGLGGRFKMPLGTSLEVPLDVVVDVFKLLEGDDDEEEDELFTLLPLLLLLLNVDKECFAEMDGELFVVKLFAFDSILKHEKFVFNKKLLLIYKLLLFSIISQYLSLLL